VVVFHGNVRNFF